ncbi:MAG: DMT family transporter [Paraburkholderia sp.]|uniref:DMT family transporter n=1 Tax=Paraburkholderia sp. TaxID=1926495 RepID=UPI003C30FB10
MKTENSWATALVGVTVLWGWSFVAIHESLSSVSAIAFNALRFLVGGIAMLVFLARKPRRIRFAELKDGTLAGLALFAAFTFQTTGIGYTTASNASFITGLAVVFTPLFALLLLRVQPNRQQAFGAAMAAVGLALLTLSAFSVHVGDLLVLGCAVFTALHIVVLSKVSKNHDAEVLAFVQVMVVGVLSLAWSVVTGGFSIPHTSQALTTIVVVGIGGTAIGYFVQTKAQVESSPSRIALILVLEPVFGGLFGYLLGGDRLSAVNLSGAVLIIVAMIVTEYRPRMRAASS